jgi:hypothetical protein
MPAKKHVEYAEAIAAARMEMGRDIEPCGFGHHDVGGHIVNILFYSVAYPEEGLKFWRMAVWVDGAKSAGVVL